MSMTFTSKSVSGLDVFDDVAHGLAQVLVVLHVRGAAVEIRPFVCLSSNSW